MLEVWNNFQFFSDQLHMGVTSATSRKNGSCMQRAQALFCFSTLISEFHFTASDMADFHLYAGIC